MFNLSVTEAMRRDSVGNPYTCNDGPRELSVWLKRKAGVGGCAFGGIEVVDGADVFSGRPCIQAWLRGSLPAVHQEQLNTAYVGVH